MESLTASDICRLEEEIFLHETAIESLNRKLESVKSQLDDEQKKLLIHKTRETELNAQCALLRNNLDEQTRLWRNLEESLNKCLTRLQRSDGSAQPGISHASLDPELHGRPHENQLQHASDLRAYESMETTTIQDDFQWQRDIIHEHSSTNTVKDGGFFFPNCKVTVPSIWDSSTWIQTIWSQSKHLFHDSFAKSVDGAIIDDHVHEDQNVMHTHRGSSFPVPPLYPPLSARETNSAQLLLQMFTTNQAEIIMQRHSIFMIKKDPTIIKFPPSGPQQHQTSHQSQTRVPFSQSDSTSHVPSINEHHHSTSDQSLSDHNLNIEKDSRPPTTGTSVDPASYSHHVVDGPTSNRILLYRASIWNEIQNSSLDLHFHCLHDPFIQQFHARLQKDPLQLGDDKSIIPCSLNKRLDLQNTESSGIKRSLTMCTDSHDSATTQNRVGKHAKTLDPYAIICPYEIMGTCADSNCTYQHLNKHVKRSRGSIARSTAKLPVIHLPPLRLSKSKTATHHPHPTTVDHQPDFESVPIEQLEFHDSLTIDDALSSSEHRRNGDPRGMKSKRRKKDVYPEKLKASMECDYIPLSPAFSIESSVRDDSHPTNQMQAKDENAESDKIKSISKTLFDPCGVGQHPPIHKTRSFAQHTSENNTDAPWYVDQRQMPHPTGSEWSVNDSLAILGFDILGDHVVTNNPMESSHDVVTIRYRFFSPDKEFESIRTELYLHSLLSNRTSLPFASKIELDWALNLFSFTLSFTDAIRLTIHCGRFDLSLALIELKNVLFLKVDEILRSHKNGSDDNTTPLRNDSSILQSSNFVDSTFKMKSDSIPKMKRKKGSNSPYFVDTLFTPHFGLLQLISGSVEKTAINAFCGYGSTSIYGGFQAQLILMAQATFLHNYFLLLQQFNKKAVQLNTNKGYSRGFLDKTMCSQFIRCIHNHHLRVKKFIHKISMFEPKELLAPFESHNRNGLSMQRDDTSKFCLSLFIPDIQKNQLNGKPWQKSATRRFDKILECFSSGHRLAAYIADYLAENLFKTTNIYLLVEQILIQLVHVVDCFILELTSHRHPERIYDQLRTMCWALFSPSALTCIAFFVSWMEHENDLDYDKDTQDHWGIFHRYNKHTNGIMTLIFKSWTTIYSKLDSIFDRSLKGCASTNGKDFISIHCKALSVCMLVNLGMLSEAQNILTHTIIEHRDIGSWCCRSHSELLWSQLIHLRMTYYSELPKSFAIESLGHFRKIKRMQEKNGDFKAILDILANLGVDLFSVRLQGDYNLVPMNHSCSGNVKDLISFFSPPSSDRSSPQLLKQNLVCRLINIIQNMANEVKGYRDMPLCPFDPFPRSLLLLRFFIEKLNLSGRLLKCLPLTFGFYVTGVINLDLSNNELTTLPQLSSLSSLESLDISGNQFYSIPSGIGKLKHLLKFFASNNKIERIADELLKCSALTTLDLRNNQIKELPSTLSLKLKKLTLLLLDGNPSLVCKEGQKISRF